MQYQQNFFPVSGSTGNGSVRRNPKTNIIAPTTAIGKPNIDTPKGTKKSVKTKKPPKMPTMAPEATSPLYISTAQD